MTKPTRNLWFVRMQHRSFARLLILATTAEKAAHKAIVFSKRDGVRRPVVKSVTLKGTIDVF